MNLINSKNILSDNNILYDYFDNFFDKASMIKKRRTMKKKLRLLKNKTRHFIRRRALYDVDKS